MKTKILTTILAIIFLIGIATASTATLTNVQIIKNLTDFIAGDTTSTEFSFDYPGNLTNDYNDAPLVARINITSLNPIYPVWKGDFFPVIIIQRYYLPKIFGKLFPNGNPIPMPCKEDAPIQFKPREGTGWIYTIDEVANGTFYCYNLDYYLLQLSSRNFVSLNISSNPALYPGEYSVSVELLEMEPDDSPPNITLLLDGFIFGENDTIPIKLNVTDMYPIKIVEYKITNPDLSSYYNSGWIEIQLNESSGFYEDEFDFSEHDLNESGTYWIFARACDVLGNCREM